MLRDNLYRVSVVLGGALMQAPMPLSRSNSHHQDHHSEDRRSGPQRFNLERVQPLVWSCAYGQADCSSWQTVRQKDW